MFPFNRGPDMPNVPKYFLYISYCSTLTADVNAKLRTNTNILLIYWLKPFFKLTKKVLWVLWKPTLMLLLAPFSEWFSFRAKCLWLSSKKKKLKFLRHEKIVTLQNWFINLCPFFFFLFFAYWWKKSQQLRKQIMILTFDSEGYTVLRFLEWTPLSIYSSSRPIKISRDQIISH